MPLLFTIVVVARADDTLIHARHAQSLLGATTWSRVIRIENTAPRSAYPRVVHALVFELAGRLWFYTSLNGTQSLSVMPGGLAADEADFRPLLRLLDPGFTRCTVVDPVIAPEAGRQSGAALPNGCLIESVAAWRARDDQGVLARDPRLFTYYIDTPDGRHGHTVLVYETNAGLQVFDPAAPGVTAKLSSSLAFDPVALACTLENRPVTIARTWFLPLPVRHAGALTVTSNVSRSTPVL